MEKKYEYLAVWLYSISMLTGTYLDVEDESFRELIMGFIINSYYKEHEILNKLFDFKMQKAGEISVSIDYDKVIKYGNMFLTYPQKLKEVYDKISFDDINEISRLAELFCYYCIEIDSMNKNTRKH